MIVTAEYIESLLKTAPITIYLLILCFASICTILTISLKGFRVGLKTSSIIILLLYSAIVICITVAFRHHYVLGIKYVPFWSYLAIFEGKTQLLAENIMNVVAFMPIGMLLAIGFKHFKWWHAVIVGCFFSVIIEFLQFYFERGQCEIDDVIHNSFGCVLGFCIVGTAYKSIRYFT